MNNINWSAATVQSKEDNKLVERFQDGEVEAFDELVIRYQDKIYRLAYSFVHNREDALDLSQEAFLRAFQALGRFERKAAFYSWLYRITTNLCIDFLRNRSRTKSVSLDAEDGGLRSKLLNSYLPNGLIRGYKQYSPTKYVEEKELQQHIINAVSTLSPKQREVFVLRYWDDLQIKEIANVIGRSEGTVKAHLFHAIRNLRKQLAEYLGS
ncbi:sigma-70 family RNA polymerase sigma factor [Candidatus Poribacteria bacterium]|nr:sigma-70 family RNA polymerase sigma factor [Candidatus Poribacteria bacterium]